MTLNGKDRYLLHRYPSNQGELVIRITEATNTRRFT